MKNLFLMLLIVCSAISCVDDDLDFEDNVRNAITGRIVDVNGNPKSQYTFEIQSWNEVESELLNYNSTSFVDNELVTTVRTDNDGYFSAVVPGTTNGWTEVITNTNGNQFRFLYNGVTVTSDYMVAIYNNNTAQLGTITLIQL